ncbi:MAG TPA: cytochrome P450 [Acidimicrobiales bacterium]|nr:cytochrome P450 [Acidimicrobiales bacterium]
MSITLSHDELERHLVSPEFVADPYATLRQMREEAPVYWSDSVGGWLITRYDDVMTTFKHTGDYSNEGRLGRAAAHVSGPDRQRLSVFEEHYRTKGLLHSDPPDHTRLRRLTVKAFTPSRIDALRPQISGTTAVLLDKCAQQGGMEAIGDLASALPVQVLSDLMGLPPGDQPLLRRWADQLLGFQGINKPNLELLLAAQTAIVEIRHYLTQALEDRRKNPGDDLLTAFAMSESEPGGLSTLEVINTCQTLLVAGHETTRSLVGNGLALLLSDRARWERLVREPTLVRTAIEEVVRYESPVARQPRLLKHTTRLGEVELQEGDVLFQMLNGANRDPAYFDNPDEFQIDREPNKHVGFGFGTHFCIGAPLARVEGEIALTALIQRFPSLSLAEPTLHWDDSKANSRMLTSLPVAV